MRRGRGQLLERVEAEENLATIIMEMPLEKGVGSRLQGGYWKSRMRCRARGM